MPLREHLVELRRRLFKSALGIGAGAVVGWFVYDWLFQKLQEPLREVAAERGIPAQHQLLPDRLVVQPARQAGGVPGHRGGLPDLALPALGASSRPA